MGQEHWVVLCYSTIGWCFVPWRGAVYQCQGLLLCVRIAVPLNPAVLQYFRVVCGKVPWDGTMRHHCRVVLYVGTAGRYYVPVPHHGTSKRNQAGCCYRGVSPLGVKLLSPRTQPPKMAASHDRASSINQSTKSFGARPISAKFARFISFLYPLRPAIGLRELVRPSWLNNIDGH